MQILIQFFSRLLPGKNHSFGIAISYHNVYVMNFSVKVIEHNLKELLVLLS